MALTVRYYMMHFSVEESGVSINNYTYKVQFLSICKKYGKRMGFNTVLKHYYIPFAK